MFIWVCQSYGPFVCVCVCVCVFVCVCVCVHVCVYVFSCTRSNQSTSKKLHYVSGVPLILLEEVEPPTKFSKRVGDLQEFSFQRGVAGKEGVNFSGGTFAVFFQKKTNKLKSEIFNNKKSL